MDREGIVMTFTRPSPWLLHADIGESVMHVYRLIRAELLVVVRALKECSPKRIVQLVAGKLKADIGTWSKLRRMP
eukprot:1117406-Amphidinium_carterae.1